MAEIGWIDFSPEHRQRVGAILDMLKPEGMVDELGIGIIRDALADRMFPGFSTIQTRAKYFFIIPYILFDYQMLKRRNNNALRYLEQREYEVMWELAEKYNHKDGCGVIGITKRKRQTIARRPSAIYWNGLNVYGFVAHGGVGADTFLNRRALSAESLASLLDDGGDDAPRDDSDAEHENHFNLRVPYDAKWAANLGLDLTRDEADLFLHRLQDTGRGKLIGELTDNERLFAIFGRCSPDFNVFVKAAQAMDIPDEIRKVMVLAHDFSEFIYGAHIAYNCQLQELKFQSKHYEKDWRIWLADIKKSMIDYRGFDPEALFEYSRTTRGFTRAFVKDWWDYISGSGHDLKRRDKLIFDQEARNKLSKARLRWNKLDDVRSERWIGLEKLSYRMKQVKDIMNDVFKGLKK
jgi:hypothetical protein